MPERIDQLFHGSMKPSPASFGHSNDLWMSIELPPITYVHDLDELHNRRQIHSRRALAGTELRIARGAYVESNPWELLGDRDRYLTTIRAVAATRRHDMPLSHWSAAAIHGLPILATWPSRVHVTVGKVSGGRSRRGVTKHALTIPDEDLVEVDGLLLTSVARTVLDMAVTAGFLTSIMIADHALLVDRFGRNAPMIRREDLWETFARRGNFVGSRRAEDVIHFAETRAESPLESVSRANMRLIGCPSPELQVSFSDHEGYIGDGDFYWRNWRIVGEADGRAKYLDAALRNNRPAAEVVMKEKTREDRIRALGESVTRWPWEVGVDPMLLKGHLRRAGIPI